MSEGLFVYGQFGNIELLGVLGCEFAGHGKVGLFELFQEGWGNGESVAACQLYNFADVAEGSPHNDCLVVVVPEIVVNIGH